jgi:hypothetical protein
MEQEYSLVKYNFIIPYRDRSEHLEEFVKSFSNLYQDKDCEFIFVHQCDTRPFNRGAMKNIGFLEFSKYRPDGLFIFNDIDVLPTYDGSIVYDTAKGQVRHPAYGVANVNLGGICCFWKDEFDAVNGFPNYWGWGPEDMCIKWRVSERKITIDESNHAQLNSSKCKRLDHKRDPKEPEYDREGHKIFNQEKKTKVSKDGIKNIKYEVISITDVAPRMKMYNVKFDVI